MSGRENIENKLKERQKVCWKNKQCCMGNNEPDMPPNSSRDPKVGPRTKQWKKKKVGARSLTCSISRLRGHAEATRWD